MQPFHSLETNGLVSYKTDREGSFMFTRLEFYKVAFGGLSNLSAFVGYDIRAVFLAVRPDGAITSGSFGHRHFHIK